MDEKTLLKISLIVALLGLSVLAVLSHYISAEEKKIALISVQDRDSDVRIQGTVSSVRQGDSVQMIEVAQASSISVVVFGDSLVESGQTVEVVGEVKEYKGRSELLAKEITVVDT